jgi:tetratricopeptide (TPR) repeat protein
VASFREALRLDPKLIPAHVNLGTALQEQGHFADALAALRRAQDLSVPTHPRLPALRQSIREYQLLLEYDGLLPAILRGEAGPATAADGIQLAGLCQRPNRQRYAAAARLYRDAFAAVPQLAEVNTRNRYNAACAAALAGCGRGKDAAGLDEEGRSAWRQQAWTWLRADLAFWAKEAEKTDPKVRGTVRQRFQHWQKDADLSGVRDPVALAKLPEAERRQWRQLWADVEALGARAAAPGAR